MTETERLLRELIALPSVNPAFLPAGHSHAGENRAAEYLARKAAQAGLTVEFKKALPQRANLLLRLTPSGRARHRVLLAPHLDTVGAARDQFIPRRAGSKLYGRGACDTKGSVAAMFRAMCEVAERRRPAATEILFAGLVDEENNQSGSRALAASGFKADLAIVGEPTGLKVVTAHKGSLWMRFETHGVSAHGSRPDLGRNAVHEMAKIVDLLETDYAASLKSKRHPLLGQATVSVGVIKGGTQANIVPDRCSILVDRRTLPGETEDTVRREIQTLLKRRGLRAVCADDKLAPCRPLDTNPKLPLVTQLLAQISQRKPAGVDYFSDAAVLAEGGIPSIVFGPGNIAQAHTADEWIDLAQLERAKNIFVDFFRSLP
ncbi:MAG TPA: M20 family metallopeptidase [Patescibacteria group bacterium]|nr:M20 family metallopeptidase [Patescibacteria group bacterium]